MFKNTRNKIFEDVKNGIYSLTKSLNNITAAKLCLIQHKTKLFRITLNIHGRNIQMHILTVEECGKKKYIILNRKIINYAAISNRKEEKIVGLLKEFAKCIEDDNEAVMISCSAFRKQLNHMLNELTTDCTKTCMCIKTSIVQKRI